MKAARSIGFAALGAAGLVLVLGAAKPAHKQPPPPPPPPPAGVTLSLVAPFPDRDWTVTLANAGPDPIRIVADRHLLSFDVTSAGHEHHCVLPADMRPSTDTVRTLAVPPGRSWSTHVDPQLYCFGAAGDSALAPGATVTASFGFTPDGSSPPFAITPFGDAGAAVRRIEAPVVTLAAAQTPADAGTALAHDAGVAPRSAYPVRMKIALPARLDAYRAFEQSVPVTVTNETDRTVRTLVAATTLGFVIETPDSHVYTCGGATPATAIAELVSTMPPRGRVYQYVDLGAVCGPFLRLPGLYRVRPQLDTRLTTPPPGGGEFWNGKTTGAPMLLRIREGEESPPSPRLDPPPPAPDGSAAAPAVK